MKSVREEILELVTRKVGEVEKIWEETVATTKGDPSCHTIQVIILKTSGGMVIAPREAWCVCKTGDGSSMDDIDLMDHFVEEFKKMLEKVTAREGKIAYCYYGAPPPSNDLLSDNIKKSIMSRMGITVLYNDIREET